MASKQFYLDGSGGTACIVGYANAYNARVDPYNNLADVYLHSSLPYLQFRAEYGPTNVSFSAVNRAYYTWDDGGGGKGGGICFITTACVDVLGMEDDCHELMTLRRFRDKHMFTSFELAKRVLWYYENAPRICTALKKRDDSTELFTYMFETYIKPSVEAVDSDDNAKAAEIYEQLVRFAAEKAGV